MKIEELKRKIVADRHQLVQMDYDGCLLASCDSILPLANLVGQQVLPILRLFDGEEKLILQLRPGAPPILFPRMDFTYQGQYHRCTMEFWAQEDFEGIFWLLSAVSVPKGQIRKAWSNKDETQSALENALELGQNLREYTAKLEQANESLQRFAYIVSHDLKAPLRAVGNIAAWIGEAIESGDYRELPEHLRLLRNRIQRIDGLIDGITRYHRIGRSVPEMGEVDLRALMLELHATIFTDRPCALILPPELPILYCCRTALYQVFSNLFSNVQKYGRQQDCRLEVGYRDDGQFHAFGVIDNGPGIDPKHHKKIFEIFQILQSKDDNESTGIGLSIVQRIVDEIGGRVWVESDLGKGAAFWFTWMKTKRPVRA